MTDKEKIKAEVERMMAEEMQFYETACNEGNEEATGSPMAYTRLQMLLNFINSIPEEPARKVWHDMDEVPQKKADIVYYCPDRNKIESRKGGMGSYTKYYTKWAYTNDLVEIAENPQTTTEAQMSDDLEDKICLLAEEYTCYGQSDYIRLKTVLTNLANWQNEQIMKDAVVLETKVMKDSDGDGIETPYEEWLTLEDTEITHIPDSIGLKEGDKVKLIIVKED